MFRVGDVIQFESVEARKIKYHLCISLNGHYLFVNSPKAIAYPGDFVLPCSELPFLPMTESGNSIISCTLVMKKSDAELKRLKAKKLGSISSSVLSALVAFVERNPVLTDEQKEIFFAATGDWI